jgi:ubiquinone/menaquinone biosynthesis C-methylase UbiE
MMFVLGSLFFDGTLIKKMTPSVTNTQWQKAVGWYSGIMGETGDELNFELIRPTLLEILGDLKDKKLLDCGCGSGYLTHELSLVAETVVGTDFSQNFVDLCKEKYGHQNNLDFQLSDVTQKMRFEDNSFDVVLSKMVLQYVENINVFASESCRIVTKAGKVVIAVDHPFHRQFYYAQSLAGKTGPSFDGLNGYFSREAQTKTKIEKNGNKIDLTWYPKTISDYIEPFIDAGLCLAKIKEIGEVREGITIPRVLFLEFKKH